MRLRPAIWWCVGLVLAPAAAGSVLAAPRHGPVSSPATVPPSAPPGTDVTGSTVPTASTVLAPAMGPLVVVPPGCTTPIPALAVFTGTIIAVDDPDHPTAVRYRVSTVLAGSLTGYQTGDSADVRYGSEARFLVVGTSYIVGVRTDEATGVLISAVRQQAPMFGGDAVIGVNDSDTDCPTLEDPVRTLLADGSSVETGVLSPLKGHGSDLALAVLKPLGIAFVVLVLLVTLKLGLFGAVRETREQAAAQRAPARRRPQPY
jgi:hypothetical protein